MVFAGSDWSPASIKMANDIFSHPQFMRFAESRFVLLVIDAPRTEAGMNTLANAEQNYQLRRQFQLLREKDIPAVALLDAGGTPYRIEGYFPNGADEYIKHLNLVATDHKTRDDLIKRARPEAILWRG